MSFNTFQYKCCGSDLCIAFHTAGFICCNFNFNAAFIIRKRRCSAENVFSVCYNIPETVFRIIIEILKITNKRFRPLMFQCFIVKLFINPAKTNFRKSFNLILYFLKLFGIKTFFRLCRMKTLNLDKFFPEFIQTVLPINIIRDNNSLRSFIYKTSRLF